MTCRQCQGIEREFDRRVADGDLRRYRRKGPSATTRALVQALLERGVSGRLLDIGGGVGPIQHALLDGGAERAVSVEASTAYQAAAAAEAERRGLSERIEAIHGDFVDIAAGLQPAEVVTLDRVICCYDDMRALVGRSAALARRLYGVVYPRRAWWLRPAMAVLNAVLRLRRSGFRVFLHATEDVEAIVRGAGLARVSHRHIGMWQVAVFARGS